MKKAFEYPASGQRMEAAKCQEVVREWRWPDGVKCPACDSGQTYDKRGHRQRYSCQEFGGLFSMAVGDIEFGK